jgi:hypothetical protein
LPQPLRQEEVNRHCRSGDRLRAGGGDPLHDRPGGRNHRRAVLRLQRRGG